VLDDYVAKREAERGRRAGPGRPRSLPRSALPDALPHHERLHRLRGAPKDRGAANATINRELAAARRAFRLAGPHIALLREHNVRSGFVEGRRLRVAPLAHLPAAVQPVARFGFITGWRLSEVLGLEWRQVDLARGGTARPGTTKNGRGGVFPFTAEVRAS